MRILPLMMLAGGLILSAAPVCAQTYDPSYPVCLKIYSGSGGGGGEYNECMYTSLAQCAATASGRAATCVVNPFYASAYRSPPSRFYQRRGY